MASKVVRQVLLVVGCACAVAVVAAAGPRQAQTGSEGQVYRPGAPGLTNPVAIKTVEPRYTSQAMKAKIEGTVELQVVIRADGTVSDVRVIRSLDSGLDEQAVAAAKQWMFQSGLLNGRPVNMIVSMLMTFRLHDGPGQAPQTPATSTVSASQGDDILFMGGAVRFDAPGVVAPKVLRMIEPKYTPDAMRQKIQGTVDVDVIVMPDGSVSRARIAKSLDRAYGLDDQALAAAREFTFEPGTLNGQAVPVMATVTLSFRLH